MNAFLVFLRYFKKILPAIASLAISADEALVTQAEALIIVAEACARVLARIRKKAAISELARRSAEARRTSATAETACAAV